MAKKVAAKKPVPKKPVVAPKPASSLKRGTVAWYEDLFKKMVYDPGKEAQIAEHAKIILKGLDRYNALEKQTGVPSELIGCIHMMEATCNFKAYLGNGEQIIGTGRKSKLVPKGRGPFKTFEAGALDALNLLGLLDIKNWSLGLVLQYAEKFNGLGYLLYHPEDNSPYIWACTNMNDGKGKYVKDGKYDKHAPTDEQVGVAAMFKWLADNNHITLNLA
jgi:lysozyme family protein